MYYLTDFCCLCLKCDKNVISQTNINLDVREIMTYVIPDFELKKSEIPIQICDTCLNNLNNFSKFRQNCQQNMITFTEYAKKLIKKHGSYKYLSVKTDQISRKELIQDDIESSEEPSFEITVKREILEDEDNNSVIKHHNEIDNKNIEEVLIKVEKSDDDFYMKEEIIEEFLIEDEQDFLKEDTHDILGTNSLAHEESSIGLTVSSDATDKKGMADETYQATNVAVQNLIPLKSKQIYERVHTKFVQWCKPRKIVNYSENCLLDYFQSLHSKKALWSHYSMLKACLIIRNNVDISKFARLKAFLKTQTRNQNPRKSKVLDEAQIRKFINESPDYTFLLMKVVLIMGISGALRREELCKMSEDDIEFKTDVVIVTIPATKTSTVRRFAITDVTWIALLLKYKKLRPVMPSKRFFLTYRDGKCLTSPVGLNTFGKIPSKIAGYLGLATPAEYTGHCFRRSSATMFAHQTGLHRYEFNRQLSAKDAN